MSETLERLYASAPVDDLPIYSLELIDSAFAVEGFPPGVVRIVQGFDDLNLGLEDETTEAFTAFPFGLSLPAKSVKGRQDLGFRIDNVTGEILRALDASQEEGNITEVILRVHAASDLSYPANPPVKMTAIDMDSQGSVVNIIASFHDLVNQAWPSRRYTPTFAPGLKYYG